MKKRRGGRKPAKKEQSKQAASEEEEKADTLIIICILIPLRLIGSVRPGGPGRPLAVRSSGFCGRRSDQVSDGRAAPVARRSARVLTCPHLVEHTEVALQ